MISAGSTDDARHFCVVGRRGWAHDGGHVSQAPVSFKDFKARKVKLAEEKEKAEKKARRQKEEAEKAEWGDRGKPKDMKDTQKARPTPKVKLDAEDDDDLADIAKGYKKRADGSTTSCVGGNFAFGFNPLIMLTPSWNRCSRRLLWAAVGLRP